MDGRVFTILIVICFCSFAASKTLRRQKRIVGGVAAAQPPEDDPVVYITKNGREARVYGIRDPGDGFYVFRGIRFGNPPVGRNRFQRPTPVHLEGEINATKWGPPCPQPGYNGYNQIVGSEDCLFLNVFTPMLPDAGEGYPVLIWIHGGGFRRGSACQYEMRNLIKKKMIVVSIQYRLGSLGFLSLGDKDLPGNNGMFDMVLAVNWVKDYIDYFGGNSKKIVAFGHGTGAASALMLSVSKLCRNSFSGLIAMSGSILSHFAVDKDPLKTARDIASKSGCPTDNAIRMVRCLQEVPVEKLIEVDSMVENTRINAQGFLSSLSSLLSPGIVVEGADDQRSLPNFITETPEDYLKLEDFPTIPLLTGVVKDETAEAILGRYRQEVQQKVETIPNFYKDLLIPTLQSTIPNFGNGSRFVPEAFSKYLNVLPNGYSGGSVKKIAEAMGDSLYNVPAFLTVDRWSRKGKAFLYRFDHKGKRNYGKAFLMGMPIIDPVHTSQDVTSHGDELGYIFHPNSITGENLYDFSGDSNEEDERVSEIFTNMIADFARNGDVNTPDKSNNASWLPQMIPTFSSESNSFMSITPTPKVLNNFRYCEMGLWTCLTQRLQSPTCGFLRSTLDVVEYGAQKTISAFETPISAFEDVATGFFPNSSERERGGNSDDETRNEGIEQKLVPRLPKIPRVRFPG